MIFDETTSAYTTESFYAAAQKFFLRNNRQGIILINLDGFKHINHLHGRQVCNSLLNHIVRDIYNIIPNVLIGRVTDDEFAIFITKVESRSELEAYAAKIVETSRTTKNINDSMVMCTVSAGVLEITREKYEKNTFREMMEFSELAMITGKRSGGNRYVMFTDEIAESFRRNDYIRQELQRIISEDHTLYKYQPITDLTNGKVCGFELLARMTEDSSEIISPAELFHTARSTNMMQYFDIAALRTACNALNSLEKNNINGIYISVNVSPEFFLSSNFFDTITQIVHNFGTNMNTLVIELTEETFIDSYDRVKETIDRLSDMGIRFYIDDFGIGYSNLSRLQELNMSTLKLDKSLVDKLEINDSLIKKLIEIARIFDMQVVAEGIETERQLQLLTEIGCDMGQGYYIGRPMSYDDMVQFIKENQ